MDSLRELLAFCLRFVRAFLVRVVKENRSRNFNSRASKKMSKKVDVPPELPALLKNYTKAVIRTQPEDLLKW